MGNPRGSQRRLFPRDPESQTQVWISLSGCTPMAGCRDTFPLCREAHGVLGRKEGTVLGEVDAFCPGGEGGEPRGSVGSSAASTGLWAGTILVCRSHVTHAGLWKSCLLSMEAPSLRTEGHQGQPSSRADDAQRLDF